MMKVFGQQALRLDVSPAEPLGDVYGQDELPEGGVIVAPMPAAMKCGASRVRSHANGLDRRIARVGSRH
jgi:hypothetical protein